METAPAEGRVQTMGDAARDESKTVAWCTGRRKEKKVGGRSIVQMEERWCWDEMGWETC